MLLSSPDEPEGPRQCAVRMTIVVAVVAAWVLVGWAAALDVDAYLLLGAPIVILFQRFLARRPLRALWVRAAPPMVLGPRGWVIAAAFAIMPVVDLARSVASRANVTVIGWDLCALAGAAGVAYALVNLRRDLLRPGIAYAALALACGILVITVAAMMSGRSPWIAPARLMSFVRDLLLYLPVTFVIEEVAFRGAFDSFVGGTAIKGAAAIGTAIVVAALWGLWHWPLMPDPWHALVALRLIAVHVPIGVFLALSWRSGGTLPWPALAHALVDAWRNAVLS